MERKVDWYSRSLFDSVENGSASTRVSVRCQSTNAALMVMEQNVEI